jgi:hypothetical protein
MLNMNVGKCFLKWPKNIGWEEKIEDTGFVKFKHRFRPENLATTEHFGNNRISYNDNIITYNIYSTVTSLPSVGVD